MLRSMNPAKICKQVLGADRIKDILGEFTSPQIKAVLKEGGVKVKLPGGYVSQQKRRALWTERIMSVIDTDIEEAAAELLQQWLLNHRRQMLIDLLDHLGVKHRQGETDESFLVSHSVEKLREGATWLLTRHRRDEAVAYLRYIAHQQRAMAFDAWDGLDPLAPADDTSEAPTE